MIVIRKASAHGLGHLRAPYDEKDAPRDIPAPVVPLDEIEVERWQHDFWQRIIQAALKGPSERPDFSKPTWIQPACGCSLCRNYTSYAQRLPPLQSRKAIPATNLAIQFHADVPAGPVV